MKLFWGRVVFLASALAATPAVAAGAEDSVPPPDKSAFTLFHRTPETMLRELNTDRPDVTESPYTVDAGWWQLEMDLFTATRDHDTARDADVRTRATTFANLNLKVGLTPRIDLQTMVESFTRRTVRDRIAGSTTTISGFGDVTSRLKINLWGDDGGPSAGGVMPFVKSPTNQHVLGNRHVEGGLILPYARQIGGGWDLGVMTELDVVRNDADTAYQADWLNTVTLGHDLVGKLAGYLELTELFSRSGNQATFDCGLTYGASRHVQLDTGANFGLTKAAPDLNWFAGISVRF